jgi:hypothetical protein
MPCLKCSFSPSFVTDAYAKQLPSWVVALFGIGSLFDQLMLLQEIHITQNLHNFFVSTSPGGCRQTRSVATCDKRDRIVYCSTIGFSCYRGKGSE